MTLSTKKHLSGNWSLLVKSASVLDWIAEVELNASMSPFNVRQNAGTKLDIAVVLLKRMLIATETDSLAIDVLKLPAS